MCNADEVSDDPADMTGHDMSKHPEAGSGDSEEGAVSE